jgi:cellulose synthase/poly-beta-1,6-N-acetylglucosamine synthase-like glycosyltransferase
MDRQTRRPDLVVVIADNCTDDTERVVRNRGGAVVVTTINNSHKKAGALNLVMERLLPRLHPTDGVLVVDADSALDDGFVAAAVGRLGTLVRNGSGRTIGGVGGTFRGGRGGGFVGMLQRNEYARYARDVRRLQGRVLVLTGTAALFSVSALRRVVQARAFDVIPGGAGQVYDTNVLTEDNELTLALLHLGYAVLSPRECLLETEIMTTWGDLWKQRVRWKRGALENLMDYGLTPVTRRYWMRQLLTHFGVLITAVYLLTVVLSIAFSGGIHLHPIWVGVTGVFIAERVITVRDRGPAQMALAGLIFVEMSFDVFLQAAQARAFWQTVRRSERNW